MVTTQGMLVEPLDLERIEVDSFRGRSPGENLSLHAYFIRPGDPDLPIVYTVDRRAPGELQVQRAIGRRVGS